MRDGQAEYSHHGVADVLLDPTAVLLDGVASDGEQPCEERADVLRVERLAQRRRADHVGE